MATRSAVLFCFFLVLHFLDATIAETEYYGTNWNDAAVEAVEAVEAANEVLRIFGRKRREKHCAFLTKILGGLSEGAESCGFFYIVAMTPLN